MTSTVPGFDDWLTDILTKEAARAGESVDKFIARAVTARITVEQARRRDPHLAEIVRRARRMDLTLPDPQPHESASVIADPQRLQALYQTGLLEPGRSTILDRIVEMAVAALAVPAAAVSLVDRDRVYVASAIGLVGELAARRELPLDGSISRPIVNTGERLIVEDARTDPALQDHPMVRDGQIGAFAGLPITDGNGHAIGTLTVWDTQPRAWSAGHLQVLADLTAMVRQRSFGDAADVAD